jgi:hypothetical protein
MSVVLRNGHARFRLVQLNLAKDARNLYVRCDVEEEKSVPLLGVLILCLFGERGKLDLECDCDERERQDT